METTTHLSDRDSLFCTEVLDLSDLNKTPEQQNRKAYFNHDLSQQCYMPYPEMPPTVKAMHDDCQINDDRILQNLLRNEDKYLPDVSDYMKSVQCGSLNAQMRKIVAEWMLEVVHEQNSHPEVFCLAMNIMDRFLSRCRIVKNQLQLLGSVCLLIASKVREPCPIPGLTLIKYTDYSITSEELKDWELLVLYKLQWEVIAITPMDFLDHTMSRLALDDMSSNDLNELRRRIETIVVLTVCDYQFSYHSPSLLAASSILLALNSLSNDHNESQIKEIKLRLRTVTHTATEHIDTCIKYVNDILPPYLKAKPVTMPSPDSSSALLDYVQATYVPSAGFDTSYNLPDSTVSSTKSSPEPDLRCKEVLQDESLMEENQTTTYHYTTSPEDYSLTTTSSSSRSSSPLSAVDVFNDYNTNILQHVFEQAEKLDSSYSILVS